MANLYAGDCEFLRNNEYCGWPIVCDAPLQMLFRTFFRGKHCREIVVESLHILIE